MQSGTIDYNTNKIQFTGTPTIGFKYVLKELAQTEKTVVKPTIAFICDFSWSMQNMAKPFLDSIKTTCMHLFNNDTREILLVFFGETPYLFPITSDTIDKKLSDVMDLYFDQPNIYEKLGKFQPNATVPELAFNVLIDYISKVSNIKSLQILFTTDGQFNGDRRSSTLIKNYYQTQWKEIATKISKLNIENYNIICLSIKNDSLDNIKLMNDCFNTTKNNNMLTYNTIKEIAELPNAFQNIMNQMSLILIPRVHLHGLTLILDEPVYSMTNLTTQYPIVLTSDKQEVDVYVNPQNPNKLTKIPQEWKDKVIALEIEIGIYENDILSSFKNISKLQMSEQKTGYKLLVQKMIPQFNKFMYKKMELGQEVKSLKSRNIGIWKLLTAKYEDFIKLLSDIQLLVTEELNEKKSFEISTNINLNSKHSKTMARRRILNEHNRSNIAMIDKSTIVSTNPLKLSISIKNNESIEELLSSQEALDEEFICFYTQANWSDVFEESSLFGILMKYEHKENDDWTPSRANISHISTSGISSLEGYEEIQNIVGGINPVHQDLYGSNKYIDIAHDKTNAWLPIATDPFIFKKAYIVKERLSHMLVGSNIAYTNRHILIYTAALRQTINQLLTNDTFKMKSYVVCIVNTFRMLAKHINPISDKAQKAMSNSQVLYNISIGNTAPYLFSTPWEPTMYGLICSGNEYQQACDNYNDNSTNKVTLKEFRKLVWLMIFRSFVIRKYENDEYTVNNNVNSNVNNNVNNNVNSNVNSNVDGANINIKDWINPEKTWGLDNADQIKKTLEKEGPECINNLLMTEEKINNISPQKIKDDIYKISTSWTLVNIFKIILKFTNECDDGFWDQYSKKFIFDEKDLNVMTEMVTMSNNDFTNIIHNTYWECYLYGCKECFPCKSYDEMKSQIVKRINNSYGDSLNEILNDYNELNEFKKRKYETRYLPITMTPDMVSVINLSFDQVYNHKAKLDDFIKIMRSVLGPRVCRQIDEAFDVDKVDVLKNLYEFCQKKNHQLKLKPTMLPYSCPAEACSPLFLQELSEIEFSRYFRPLGFGWANKKYSSWVGDLHPFMVSNVQKYSDVDSFIKVVLAHVNEFKSSSERNIDNYKDEIRNFYDQYSESTGK